MALRWWTVHHQGPNSSQQLAWHPGRPPMPCTISACTCARPGSPLITPVRIAFCEMPGCFHHGVSAHLLGRKCISALTWLHSSTRECFALEDALLNTHGSLLALLLELLRCQPECFCCLILFLLLLPSLATLRSRPDCFILWYPSELLDSVNVSEGHALASLSEQGDSCSIPALALCTSHLRNAL